MAEKAVMRSEVAGKGPTCWIELVGQVICCNWSIDRYIKQSEEPRTVRIEYRTSTAETLDPRDRMKVHIPP